MPKIQSHPVFLSPQQLNPAQPLFIFLPGLDGTGALLRSQTAGLGSGFNVRCLSIPADDLSCWQKLTEQVVALIRAEMAQVDRREVYLCGESFGGCLALKVALAAPELFERLILVNPASSFNRRPWIAWSTSLVKWLPEPLYRTSALTLLPFLATLERISQPDRRALLKAIRSVPQKTSIWRLSLLSEFQLEIEKLRSLTQPCLLIASVRDHLLPSLAEAEHLLRILPQAQLVTLPYSGHACLLEADVNLAEIMATYHFCPQQQPQKTA